MSEVRPLVPGTIGPAAHTPRRRTRSVRRTTSADITPIGDAVGLETVLCGRDIATDGDGRAHAVDHADLRTVMDLPDRTLAAIDTSDASHDALQSLIDTSVGSGFRRALDAELGELARSGSVLALLLDEVPVASVIGGIALRRFMAQDGGQRRPNLRVDICAGWASGSVMTLAMERGEVPYSGGGPHAPSLLDPADALAWHELPPRAPGSVRRVRRLDLSVSPTEPKRTLEVEVFFRDTYRDVDSETESVIHEYTIAASIDRDDLVVREIVATPRVLPAPECPTAAASAERLVGMSLDAIRTHVRTEFRGASTCTHLNDALRSMGDLSTLVAALP